MKIARLLTLLSCVVLNLAASLDLGSFIRIGQCRSMCLQNYTDNGKCDENPLDERHFTFVECWDKCETFHNKVRKDVWCRICNSQICETVCTYYKTHIMEESEYSPIKLPAPEKGELINVNNSDIALLMRKDQRGRWIFRRYFCKNKQLEIEPDSWIIVINRNGAIRHYSWNKWQPRLQSLNPPQDGGPLYQANITWEKCQTQTGNIDESYEETKSVVVTWQEETGDGIMGNQVVDSESAQISLPSGSRYLVRVATDDGPGSYPIIIDTTSNSKSKSSTLRLESKIDIYTLTIMTIIIIMSITTYIIIYVLKQYCKNYEKKNYENIRNIEIESIESLCKMEWGILNWHGESNSCSSCDRYVRYTIPVHIHKQMMLMIRKDVNANGKIPDANTKDANAIENTHDANNEKTRNIKIEPR